MFRNLPGGRERTRLSCLGTGQPGTHVLTRLHLDKAGNSMQLPSSPSPPIDLRRLALRFLDASNAAERRSVLLDHPEILSTDAERILEETAADARLRGDTKHADSCDEHVALLRECRQTMLEPLGAFCPTPELELAFTEFAHGFRTLGERRDYLQAHPELLSPRLESVAKTAIDEYVKAGHPDIAATFRLYRNLLQHCREVPIDQAFAEYEVPPSDVISAFSSLWTCDSPEEILTCSLMHGDVFGSRWMKNVINFHRVKCEDNPAAMERLEALLSGNPHWR